MNQSPGPTSGPKFSRPCELSTIEPNLLALVEKGKSAGGLTPTQCALYMRLCEAWDYYRPSQPPRYRGRLDGLVDAIAAFEVVA